MQWMNPEVASGQEPSLVEMLETWVELSRQDASVDWNGIANFTSSAFAATLPGYSWGSSKMPRGYRPAHNTRGRNISLVKLESINARI